MRVIDLFCGAGLFSEGFRRAGFEVVLGVDIEPRMLSTFRRNHPETEVWERDVLTVDPSKLPDVDVIIGSPPCQQFSYANMKRNPEEGMVLVNWMLDMVRAKRPRFWVTENVPPILKYLPRWIPVRKILNAADYGVPQTRRRCFAGSYPIPPPTHARVPSSTLTGAGLKPWVSVREAIGDLPSPLLTHRRSLKDAWAGRVQPNSANPESRHMTFTIDEPSRTVSNHGIRSVNLNIDKINEYRIKIGLKPAPDSTDDPSRTILTSEGKSTEKGMIFIDPNNLNPDSRGPFGTDQPSPRSVIGKMRLEISDSPATTVQGDPRLWSRGHKANRFSNGISRGLEYHRLTVRECARLQSVPDAYAFEGPATWQYRHIGEGVPCLLAFHLANEMRPAFSLEKLNPPNDFLEWVGVDIPRVKVKEAEVK